MKKKLVASMAVVAAVAGVGVLAAGCGGDEFQNATALENQAAYQEAVAGYSNAFESFELSSEMVAETETGKTTGSMYVKVVKLDAEHSDIELSYESFTEDNKYGMYEKQTSKIDAIVKNVKGEGDIWTTTVYYTLGGQNFKTTLDKLGQAKDEALSYAEDLISEQITMITTGGYVSSITITDFQVGETTYKQIKDGDVEKYLVENTVEDKTGEGAEEKVVSTTKTTVKVVYEKDKEGDSKTISEYVSNAEMNGPLYMLGNADGHTKSSTSIKSYKGTIEAPKGTYTEAERAAE